MLAVPGAAQTQSLAQSGVKIQVIVPKPPAPFIADGAVQLVYELHVTNILPAPVKVTGVEVLDEANRLAGFRGEELQWLLMPLGSDADPDALQVIEAGRTRVLFLDLTLEPGAPLPQQLRHRLRFSVDLGAGQRFKQTVEGIAVDLQPPARLIGPPLRGGRWVAGNGLFAPHHRRSFNAVNGRESLAQRFAIDWLLLGPDDRFFRSDASANTDFAGYGADIIAVADGVVSAVIEGRPDNIGRNPISGRTVSLDTLTGNTAILDIGGGQFALYAHLQPGSIRVRPGERVRAGQVLARLGNSGNSDVPHLHFQLTDANSPLGAEGIPFAFTAFTQTGVMPDLSPLDTGRPWRPARSESVVRRGEFPVDGAVVTFP
jgi:murein DD-endopeptidase MepM/ murein hydrolase activator NlpD